MCALPEACSKGRVDRAGETLRDPSGVADVDQEAARALVDKWRLAHSPAREECAAQCVIAAKALRLNPLLMQRPKRMEAIVAKLRRNPRMELSRMQDVGGCRIVVDPPWCVQLLRDQLLAIVGAGEMTLAHDYVANPKTDGYRSVHLIWTSSSQLVGFVARPVIEVQIRSGSQHAWATALETVDLFFAEQLKTGRASKEWSRFFLLSSVLIAAYEGSPGRPDWPTPDEAAAELAQLTSTQETLVKFEGLWVAINRLKESLNSVPASPFALLQIDSVKRTIDYKFFESEAAAARVYADAEAGAAGVHGKAVALVRVQAASSLVDSYPNYFGHLQKFTALMKALQALPPRQLEHPAPSSP
ncbi:MAG: RelA/SpoT domain-containing protein [Phycisphaerae bacterium]|nr:RelA/SpoT domain-containing protein [Phycisphaerae bacterium]